MARNVARDKINYSSSDWVQVLLPRIVVQELLRESLEPKDKNSYATMFKQLQSKSKKLKLFKGLTAEQIMEKLHETRKQLLRENPHAYINYNS